MPIVPTGFIDHSFNAPHDNVACDEALFTLADKHDECAYLRFWESPQYFIVLGRIGKAEEDIHLDRARADGIPIIRRTSGGGTVLQGPGCLNYTCVLSKNIHPGLADLRGSYAWISAKVIAAAGIDAVFKPISDIAIANSTKKFSGNAQRRGKTHVLHHGTILYNFDLDAISTYLTMPKDMPEYRNSRSHKDFVTNIPLNPAPFKAALAQSLGFSPQSQPLSDKELSALSTVRLPECFYQGPSA